MTEPEKTPDLEPGGGVSPGETPPAAEATAWVHDDTDPPVTRRFPPTGRTAKIIAGIVVVLLFALLVAGAISVGINYAT
ncbi:DUF6480 family protein [Williamsia deligens]|uniref:DUF6480 family protein n=1 Tax=Williamsia deligens TaxID=321325 RepID=A0ABW3G670_9NOCA|nr:DUF6480 family protein [Williamsia deligens]MCP2193344.1 hypothetical protein [Williamsia deligens]